MITILCYGDSNTNGCNPSTQTRLKRDERWTGILQKILGDDYYVIEEGLGGRTTVWDDPIEEDKNGGKYLLPCLESHKPIDLVIIMLGTNDTKYRFSLTEFDISWGMENLIRKIKKSEAGRDEAEPKILLMAPAPIEPVGDFAMMFKNAAEKSVGLSECYRILANKYEIEFLDLASIVSVSKDDGVHLDGMSHKILAKEVSEIVEKIWQSKSI